MKNKKKRQQNGEVLHVQFIFSSKPIFFLRLAAWFPFSHPVHSFLCLCINFSCHSRKTLKGFFKKSVSLKKNNKQKNYPFYSSGIKEMVGNSWACVPDWVFWKGVVLMLLENLIFNFMEIFALILFFQIIQIGFKAKAWAKRSNYIYTTVCICLFFNIQIYEINS